MQTYGHFLAIFLHILRMRTGSIPKLTEMSDDKFIETAVIYFNSVVPKCFQQETPLTY